jgi:hypothetical protein
MFDANNFDKSEWQAWKSGVGLRNLLTNLNQKYPNQVRLSAHSMGAVVAGEALRISSTNPPLVDVYVAMQGAIPSHCYDSSAPLRTIPTLQDDGTPNRYAQYWQTNSSSYFHGFDGADLFVNFFNQRDAALGAWEIDQNFKPAGTLGYSYNQGNGKFFKSGVEKTFQANTHELFSFGVEARCKALGAQTNVAGAFNPQTELDLDTSPHNFGDANTGHSAQFLFSNMQCWPFWDRLLVRFQLKEEP